MYCVVFDPSSRLASFDAHLLRGVQELTSNTAEPLVSRGTGTANYPVDVAVSHETDAYIALRVRSAGEILVSRETGTRTRRIPMGTGEPYRAKT